VKETELLLVSHSSQTNRYVETPALFCVKY